MNMYTNMNTRRCITHIERDYAFFFFLGGGGWGQCTVSFFHLKLPQLYLSTAGGRYRSVMFSFNILNVRVLTLVLSKDCWLCSI